MGSLKERALVTIMGTAHIFDLSSRISFYIKKLKPDVVAVELDPERYLVMKREREMKEKGMDVDIHLRDLLSSSAIPFRYRLMAYLQRRLAASNHVFPGTDMLSAIDAAREVGATVALIDMSLRKTLANLQNAMKPIEKVRFYFTLLTGGRIGGKKLPLSAHLRRIESDYDSVLYEIAKIYPGLKKVLIDERDMHMARAIIDISMSYENVMAVVGDAHVEGIRRIIEKEGINVSILHLSRLMDNGFSSSNTTHPHEPL